MAIPVELEAQIRRAYALGRLRMALMYGSLVAATAGIVLYVISFQWALLIAALLASVLVGWSIFQGLMFGVAARAGLLGGAVPLIFVLIARHVPYQCATPGGCWSWCMIACAMGGGTASFVVARLAGPWHTSIGYWGVSTSVVCLFGSLACSCVGVGAAFALLLSYGIAVVPARLLMMERA